MEKRFFIALALSLIVLSLWSRFVSKNVPRQNVITVSSEITSPKSPQNESVTPIKSTSFVSSETFNYSTNQKELVFELPGANLKEIYFKKYQYNFALSYAFLMFGQDKTTPLSFKLLQKDKNEISFVSQDNTKQITKRLRFDNSKHIIELEISIRNTSSRSLKESFALFLTQRDFKPASMEDKYWEITSFSTTNETKSFPFAKIKGEITSDAWAVSLRDHYGCVIIKGKESFSFFSRKPNSAEIIVGINLPIKEILPGQTQEENFMIYLGPQDPQQIALLDPRLTQAVHYGFFDPISKILLGLLKFFHRLTWDSWGLAIILLTVFIFFILSPLSKKQMHSFKRMQELAPEIEALKKAHKNNPQKLNQEVLALYKKNKVNPFGGCFILILQIPIFFSLYQVFMRYISLKGANFLWIKDLAREDTAFTLPFAIPFLGKAVNILPIAMAIIMFLQQRLSLKSAAGANLEQQRLMLILMPILFGVLFYHMPAGLVLYWFMQSFLMYIYQWKISK